MATRRNERDMESDDETVVVAAPTKAKAEPVNTAAIEAAQARAELSAPRPHLLAIDTFVVSKFGAKNFDQYGAFVRWAKKQKLSRLTKEQWEQHLTAFQNRIIGG